MALPTALGQQHKATSPRQRTLGARLKMQNAENMTNKTEIFNEIDDLIKKVDNYRNEPLFSKEKTNREKKTVSPLLDDNLILRNLSHLIAYSQNANSKLVEKLLMSGDFDKVFGNFNIDYVAKLNPCDVADEHWAKIKGIRQQTKIFHIVTLARKIKQSGSFATILNEINIPKTIKTENDIKNFWIGFNVLLSELKSKKIPFFQSTTSLLHFLLDIGYDCVKPDLVVMKVAKKLKIVDEETGDKNFRQTVKFVQEYSIDRKVRPSVIDLYFLIDEGQMGARKFVRKEFYE